MSARQPTNLTRSLTLLRPHGGDVGPHADGWGLAFYEGRAARVFKEPAPAPRSRCFSFVVENDHQSTIFIGHIRRANPPEFGRTLANTHPFSRELGGRSWVFAHNGKLPGVKETAGFALERFHPMGDTDSEHAFCFLLDHLAHTDNGQLLDPAELVERLRRPVDALASLGELNFLLSDGEHLVVFANTDLHQLHRSCVERACEQQAVLFATKPLTEEAWQPLEHDRMRVFVGGREIETRGAVG